MTAPDVRNPLVCPVMVGRDAALDAILDAVRRRVGRPVVRVFGEAGIGKSRVVSEALRRVSGRRVLSAACFEADGLLPLAPFLDLFAHADIASGDELATRIGVYVRGAAAMPEAARQLARRELFDDFARHLAGEDRVVVLEDIHWADQATLDALLHVARREPARVRLLLTYRDDEGGSPLAAFHAAVDRSRLAVDVPLARLGRDDVARMVEAMVADRPGRRLVETLVQVTDGNPFFVEEVLGALDTRSGDGTIHVEAVPVPRTVRAAVGGRLRYLSEDAGQVASVAAVAGRRLDIGLLSELVGIDDAAVLDAIRELIRVGVAVQTPGSGAVEFRHELTRIAVYERLIGHERRRLHAEIANALERTHDGAAGGDLARHYELAAEWESTLIWAERAGRRAQALHSPGAAAAEFSRAIEAAHRLGLATPLGLLRARAAAYETLGDIDAAIADHEAAVTAARSQGDARAEWESLLALGAIWISRDWERAARHLGEAWERSQELGDPVASARTLNRHGNLRMVRGEQDDALRLHSRALGLLEEVAAPRDLATTLDLLAVTTMYAGDLHAARDHYERVAGLFGELDDPPGRANALAMRALCGGAHFLQTFTPALASTEAIALAEEALRLARAVEWHGESFLHTVMATVLAEAGRLGDASDHARDALRLAEEMEHLVWVVMARFYLGMTYLDALACEEAWQELHQAAELGESLEAGVFLAASLTGRARAEIDLGSLDDASESLTQAERAAPGPLTERAVAHTRALLHLATGEAAAALRLADDLIATAPHTSEGPPPALALLRAQTLLALKADDAAAAFRVADNVASRLQKPVIEWQSLAGLTAAEQAAGREPEAQRLARRAAELIDRLAAGLPGEAARRFRYRARTRIPGYATRARESQRYGGLTPRQQQVAALLAAGRTNREIAAELVISPFTAETHVKQILTRLGMSSRAEVAAWAVEHGLGPSSRT